MSNYCVLCKRTKADDGVEIECGNNAENSVILYMCEAHMAEFENDEWAFRDKYSDKIEGEWLKNMLSYADSLRE